MKDERLAPRMQHGEESDLGAEMCRVSGDGAEGLGRRSKQDGVDDRLVLERDRRDRCRHGEDHMEVLRVEQVGLTSVDPGGTGQRLTPGTMPIPAGVEPDPRVAAVIALLHMAAQCGGPALLDRRHDAALPRRERRTRLQTIGLSVAAEDLRHVDRGAMPRRAIQRRGDVRLATGRGNKSRGLVVAQTLVVARRR